jgi:hypothetical protein
MKMNSLTALRTVCDRVGSPAGEAMLEAHKPHAYQETVDGRTMAQVQQLCSSSSASLCLHDCAVGMTAITAFFYALCPHTRSSILTGVTVCFMQAGCEPILHMRHFQKAGSLSDKLVQDIVSRNA